MKRKILSIVIGVSLATSVMANGPRIGVNSSSSFGESSIYSSDRKISESAHFIHLAGVVPFTNYLSPITDSLQFGFGPSLGIGSMFQIIDFGPDDNFAFGVRLSYLKAMYSQMSINDTTRYHGLQGSMFNTGIYFTFGFNDEMGVDVFYQVGPTYVANILPNGKALSYFGATHSIGVGWRYDILSVGFEFNVGDMLNVDDGSGNGTILNDIPVSTGHFRFFLGVAF